MFMKTYKLLIISIFMLIASVSLHSSVPSSTFNLCNPDCTPASTTVTMSEFVKVGDCLVEVFYDLWTCPEDVFTINLKGFNLDCNGIPPSNADIMKAIKKYLLTIAHPLANNGEINPNDFKVQILAPSCYYLEPNGPGKYYADRRENVTKGRDSCANTCCSNTYTINSTTYPYQLFVTNIVRGTDPNTSSTCSAVPNYCQNACDENEIVEGPITYDYFACGLPGTESSYLFGDDLTNGYTPKRDYMSVVDASISGSNYYVQPRAIIGISSSGVSNGDDMKNYIMDLIYHRTSVFNVSSSNVMYLYINQCWENYNGTAYPCSEECCQFKIEFLMNNIIQVTSLSSPSGTCTSPCFEVCDKIMELHNQPIINAKALIEDDFKDNIYEDLKIIPNPSYGTATIKYKSEDNGQVELQILTLDGQTIATRNFTKEDNITDYNFNTKTFSNGTYFVKIFLNGKQRIVKKMIIQN